MGSNMVLTGNYAAAEAAALCRPDLVAAYPITRNHLLLNIWQRWSMRVGWIPSSSKWSLNILP